MENQLEWTVWPNSFVSEEQIGAKNDKKAHI